MNPTRSAPCLMLAALFASPVFALLPAKSAAKTAKSSAAKMIRW